MGKRFGVSALLAVVFSLSPCAPHAQTDDEVQHLKQYLTGQRLMVSYREGGAAYGTHIFLDIHYCPSGQYLLYGQSRKQTVLDNWQVNNWEDYGRWDVVRYQGQVGIGYVSTQGQTDFIPVQIRADGSLWAGEGVSIQRQGRAQCG